MKPPHKHGPSKGGASKGSPHKHGASHGGPGERGPGERGPGQREAGQRGPSQHGPGQHGSDHRGPTRPNATSYGQGRPAHGSAGPTHTASPRSPAPRGDDGASRLHLPPRPSPEPGDPRRQPAPFRHSDTAKPRRPAEAAHQPRHSPDAPRGTVWLYGQHAVAAALANPNRRLRRLLLTADAETALSAQLPLPWPISPEPVDRGRLDHLLGRETTHQGVALLADLLNPPALTQALERPGPVLVLDQVSDPRNVGAILRAAAAFGAAAVITQERNAPEETGALAKAASGALEKLPLFRAVNIARTLVALKAAGLWVVGLDAGGGILSGPALRQRRIALVLGSEGEGLRRLTRDTCDEIAGLAIPTGHASEMESLNVSAAAAIALYELSRE